jgi:alkylhydroperoxidase family enzyme
VLGEPVTQAALDDWRTAPASERVRAMLGFLEKLTLSPEEVTPDDVDAVRAKGVGDEAIEDAVYICVLFNMIDRIAGALGFEVPGPEAFAKSGRMLLRHGYELF